jgi:hypothetical protein
VSNTASADALDVQAVLRSLPKSWPGPIERLDLFTIAFPDREPVIRHGYITMTDDELFEMREKTRPSNAEWRALLSLAMQMRERWCEGQRWWRAGMPTAHHLHVIASAEAIRALLSLPCSWRQFDSAMLAVEAIAAVAEDPATEFSLGRLDEAIRDLSAAGVSGFSLMLMVDEGIVVRDVVFPPEPQAAGDSADASADGPQINRQMLPDSVDAKDLARELERQLPRGEKTQAQIAREFTRGDRKKANSLLRTIRKYPLLHGAVKAAAKRAKK